MTHTRLVVFPHQLFEHHPAVGAEPQDIVLVEDNLFFGDPHQTATFHRQKLWLHRASMKRYAARLSAKGHRVEYVDHQPQGGTLFVYLRRASRAGLARIVIAEPHDDLLNRRLDRICTELGIEVTRLPTPMFINTAADNAAYRRGKRRWFMADFYKHQRRSRGLLMDGDQPLGGRWSFDEDNRRKVPKSMLSCIPELGEVTPDAVDLEAKDHIESTYPNAFGSLERLIYPTSHRRAQAWLDRFIRERFEHFGAYEDAIVAGENSLWHSVVTPMLNVGLLTPEQVIHAANRAYSAGAIPINSAEGFIRQVAGWREFMRATYEDLGVTMRTGNHWNHTHRMPAQFYTGTTGIAPVDDVIRRVLDTGYCHHIERLMVLGGFMFLCEIDPNDIYTWFMELFVDSYDWVMVPNVYAMSQNADGGLITTKPYFSGSSYIRKMGNHAKGPWVEVWDGLYWRWILNHADELAKNPRWAMMCAMGRKMDPEKQARHRAVADEFLQRLWHSADR